MSLRIGRIQFITDTWLFECGAIPEYLPIWRRAKSIIPLRFVAIFDGTTALELAQNEVVSHLTKFLDSIFIFPHFGLLDQIVGPSSR